MQESRKTEHTHGERHTDRYTDRATYRETERGTEIQREPERPSLRKRDIMSEGQTVIKTETAIKRARLPTYSNSAELLNWHDALVYA